MKKIGYLFIYIFLFLAAYTLFLFLFPLKKNVFYSNEEKVEEFVYNKTKYPVVLVGSSLSGAFEGKKLFEGKFFNLFLPFTGAVTGLDIVRRSNKIPQKLFVEINYINRGIDSALNNSIFSYPAYDIKNLLPFLQKKNKIFQNLTDRIKKPGYHKLNKRRPPQKFYEKLIQIEQVYWNKNMDTVLLNKQLDHVKEVVGEFAKNGCRIYFFEMPMDSSLENSLLIKYQREYFTRLTRENGYIFIPSDNTRFYNTGDGVHLLKDDAIIYSQYFINELSKRDKAN